MTVWDVIAFWFCICVAVLLIAGLLAGLIANAKESKPVDK